MSSLFAEHFSQKIIVLIVSTNPNIAFRSSTSLALLLLAIVCITTYIGEVAPNRSLNPSYVQ